MTGRHSDVLGVVKFLRRHPETFPPSNLALPQAVKARFVSVSS